MKNIKIWIGISSVFALCAIGLLLYRYLSIPDTVSLPSAAVPLDQIVTPSGSKIPSGVTFASSTHLLTIADPEWKIDTYDEQHDGPYVIFSAYKESEYYYGIFRFNRDSGEIKNLYFQMKQLGINYYASINQFSGAGIVISPDEKRFFFVVEPNFYWKDNFMVMDMEGNLSPIEPAIPLSVNWFTNDYLSFSPGRTSGNETMEIINLSTGVTSTTKLPVSSFKYFQTKVSPDATAFVAQEAVQKDIFGKRYTCGAFYVNLVVYSYPDRKELFRINDLHYADYRWLIDGTLQMRYQKIQETDDVENRCQNVKNTPVEEIYTLPKNLKKK